MILSNRETRKSVSMVAANGHLNEVGRVRLTKELLCEPYRPGRRVRLGDIGAKYGLDNKAVLKLFTEFQSIGLVTLSGKFSAIVHAPDAKEMYEAYEIRAGLEEIAGRTAAEVLKENTGELQKELDAMRAAVRIGDLDGYARKESCEVFQLRPQAVPIGMFADTQFAATKFQLEQNDILVAYTDGITEAANPSG